MDNYRTDRYKRLYVRSTKHINRINETVALVDKYVKQIGENIFVQKGNYTCYVASTKLVLLPVINIAIKPCAKPTEKVNAAERDVRTVPLIPQRPTFAMENPTFSLPLRPSFFYIR